MMRSLTQLTVGLIICLSTVVALADDARDPAAPSDSESMEQWLARRVTEMREYTFVNDHDGESATPKLVERSLLNWGNPIRRTSRGALFVWTLEGKPQFVCCNFPDKGRIVHEMQSLAHGRVTRIHAQRGSWVFDPPPDFEPIPEAPKPARTRTLRLVQMRKLASRFSAEVTHPELNDVRLLPQPVYRYPEQADTEGALFAFVQGTDPECLLIIESTDDGWESRAVRMTSVGLNVYRDEQQIREFIPSWEEPDPSYKNFYIDSD